MLSTRSASRLLVQTCQVFDDVGQGQDQNLPMHIKVGKTNFNGRDDSKQVAQAIESKPIRRRQLLVQTFLPAMTSAVNTSGWVA